MASTIRQDALVVFSPSGKRGRFSIGTPVLEAARSLGVDIDSVCGGRAMCGRCQVDVTEGELSKHGIVSRAENLSMAGQVEQRFLASHSAESGRRLSCHAKIEGDIAIDVPASSQVHRQVIRKPYEAHDIDVNPVVQPCFVEVTPPDILLPEGDLQRVFAALSRDWQLDGLTCNLPAMQQLQVALREGDWQITVAVRKDRQIIAVWPGLKERFYGVAIDVGSTTVAAQLCDLRNGEVLASAGKMNPQIRFGEDLMSRVSYIMSNPGSERQLSDVIRRTVNELIAEVAATADIEINDIVEVTIVGNPIMQHLFLGISPIELGRAPFKLANDESVDVRASELDISINPGGYAYVLPCIAGHVGADTAGVMLAETPFERDDMSLIVDVGTNAEILVGNRERLLAASSPTGPAFEGAQISSGQRAAPGAIERVRIDRETLEPRFKVIGCELWSDDPGFADAMPSGGVTGICGSGIIEAIAEMYLAGIVLANGRIDGELAERSARIVEDGTVHEYVLFDGDRRISITQHDVRAIQLAKAALYAGVQLLMKERGVDRVDRVRFAGAFGAQIDARYAMVLGMVPECDLDAVSSAGNAAGTGARIALLDRKARPLIEAQVRNVEKIETATRPDFQDLYVAAMAISHEKSPDKIR
jgi:uncharacterized 2Fe-2S/4Fe-4S cluster protein (DUF4445 family)